MITMDRGRTRVKKEENPSRSRSRSRSRGGRDRSRDRPANARLADKRVYISNIPYDSRWQDIKDLMRKEVGEVSFVELFSDENDKPRGCGVIEFETAVIAKKAIDKMHRFELGGRKIVVKEDYDVERDKTGRIITGSNRNKDDRSDNKDRSRGGGGVDRDSRVVILRERLPDRDWGDRGDQGGNNNNDGGKYGNTYGLSQQFLESLGVEGQLQPKVFVSNLDFRVDEKKLKEVFRLAGRVLEVDLNRDKEGKSRGHGVIEFEHPVEAVQAISMFNNQQLYERRMHVKMDRLADPLADLAKNRLPDGLKTIGMGLGVNGQPLVDVSRNLPSGNTTATAVNTLMGSNTASAGGNQGANSLASSLNTLAAMNVNPGSAFGNLASVISNSQGLDALGALGAANAFGVGGINALGALGGTPGGQFGNLGGPNAGTLAAAMQSVGGLQGMQQANNPGVNNNPLGMMGNTGGQIGTPGGMVGVGSGVVTSTPSAQQQSPFQTNQSGAGQAGGLNMRGDIEYGYSTSLYSTPNSSFGGNKPTSFGNGVGSGLSGHSGVGVTGSGGPPSIPSNTVIVANLPPSCTWQMLKSKFRECGEVVFAEMRDKSTGIVRFATERDAERAVKVFDQSRVDGRIVEVRFL